MARPKRELTTEQKIQNLISDITDTESKIEEAENILSVLKNQKRELEDALRQEKINALLEAIAKKEISLDKAKEIIDSME